MSLINQVLNDLEKRGVNVAQADAALRPVPMRSRGNWPRYVLAVLLLLFAVLAAFWYFGRAEEEILPEPVSQIDKNQYELVPGIASEVAVASMPVEAATIAEPVAEIVAPPAPPRRAAVQPEQQSEPAAVEVPVSTNMPVKVISPQQRAESEFGKASQALQEGRVDDALAGYEAALLADPHHKAARRAWVGLLLNLKRNDEAERVLQRGLRRDPHDAAFAMLLARLQVERNAVPEALQTLQKNLPDAAESADYQAFMAALLQRQERHAEAIPLFQKALALVPGNGVWMMGLGISLQAGQQKEEARAVYQRALDSNTLNPQLREFVQQKLKEL
jgi:MSHA biogenesis protein MshN